MLKTIFFDLAKTLKTNYKLGIITDNNKERFEILKVAMNLPELFDYLILSVDVGSMKDTPKIFERALEACGCRAEECVFIDNTEENLVVPKNMWFRTILFDGEGVGGGRIKRRVWNLRKIWYARRKKYQEIFMDEEVSKQAVKFIKSEKKKIKEMFAGDQVCLSEDEPVSIFMAGSPGAGKTEFSKWFLKETELKAVRIDADEIRDIIPHYNKKNANDIQRAAALGVEYIYDFALKKKKSLLLDATFADYSKSLENVKRSISKGRYVEIYYLFQDPLIAWEFTKAREELEGRHVPKDIFIKSFLQSRENVNKVKAILGKKVVLNVVVKSYKNDLERFRLNVESVDSIIKQDYNISSLEEII